MKLVPFVLATLALPAAADAVWVVDASGGAGSTHTSIQAAIDAAASGDTVLVRNGSYVGFTITGKALVVTAENGALPSVFGCILVRDLPAPGAVVLRNLTQLPVADEVGLLALQCAGSVWVENCSFKGPNGTSANHAVAVTDCDSVALLRCGMVGGRGGGTLVLGGSGGDGVRALSSSVALYDCTLQGGDGTFGDEVGGNGGSGVYAASASTVFAAGCHFEGGSGGGADDDIDWFGELDCGHPGTGGSGVRLDSAGSTAELLDSAIAPGPGGLSISADGCPDGANGVAVTAPAGTVTLLDGAARGLRIGSPRREGEATNLTFTAFDGDFAFALVAAAPGQLALPALSGTLVVDPGFFVVPGGFVPASGVVQLGVVAPDLDPAAFAATLYVQSAFATPALELRLGAASQLTIVDSSL